MPDGAIVKRPTGRPSAYSDEVALAICCRISLGESVQSICRDKQMPGERTVYAWLVDRPHFQQMYTCAREAQAEHFIDEIVDIADTVANCTDSAVVNATRLRVDVRKWAAAKRLPRRYGNRLDVESSGSLTVRIVHGLGDQ